MAWYVKALMICSLGLATCGMAGALLGWDWEEPFEIACAIFTAGILVFGIIAICHM